MPSTRYSATCEPSGSAPFLISPSATSSTPHSTTGSDIGLDLEHCASAVDADDLAGHERCFGGCEVADHGSDFLHLGGPAHGYDADELRRQRGIALCDGNHLRRVHRARRNGIDGDAVARKLARHSGGQSMDAALGGVVCGMIPKPVADRVGAEIDDPAIRISTHFRDRMPGT